MYANVPYLLLSGCQYFVLVRKNNPRNDVFRKRQSLNLKVKFEKFLWIKFHENS